MAKNTTNYASARIFSARTPGFITQMVLVDFQDALIWQTHRLFGAEPTVTFDKTAAMKLGWQLLG